MEGGEEREEGKNEVGKGKREADFPHRGSLR